MSSQPVPSLTFEQYLEIDRAAEIRSEYVGGEMFAMAGGTVAHSRIAAATLSRLYEQLRGRPCSPMGSDLRIFSVEHQIASYPDIVVTCGPDQFLDTRRDTLIDATLIVEILSPSTRNYDRSEKFRIYRSLPSFAEYLLLSQDQIRAEHHVRQPDGSWLFREYTAPTHSLELRSIDCRLTLADLYERVQFEPPSI